ncbi:2Fe-2S iron-sulfur cluster-binding protein [Halogeometricum limi]|uniref:Ferredoxin n=1 Tax=Halogeometricum limi TaxID=555875 RepID=A0A1I6I0C4_9EURY|nr:2Fe-2S iron-sulfur cluster-binding protein [Halogeometricum limi]SFR60094.1 ferredoxin [Halogeometricum limi]
MTRVRLRWADGREDVVSCDDESVLAAAEREGVRLPAGCRRGFCGTCTSYLVAGVVGYDTEPRALRTRHRRRGYVLPCIARPETACTLRVGPEVVRELRQNPWR